MRLVSFLFIFLFWQSGAYPQAQSKSSKPIIDAATMYNWPVLERQNIAISNDGKYILYSIKNMPIGSSSLVIQELNGGLEIRLPAIKGAKFTNDSRKIVYMHSGDSLCLLTIANGIKEYISDVKSSQLFIQGSKQWLACHKSDQTLVIKCLEYTSQMSFRHVTNFTLSQDGQKMIVQSIPETGNVGSISLSYVDLLRNSRREIWEGASISSILFDSESEQIAFIGQKGKDNVKAIWLFKSEMSEAKELASDQPSTEKHTMTLYSLDRFSNDGYKLFVKFKLTKVPKSNIESINIWSYTDPKLNSQQQQEVSNLSSKFLLGVIELKNGPFMWKLQNETETIWIPTLCQTDDLLLLEFKEGESAEAYWNKKSRGVTQLVNVTNKKRITVPLNQATLSPGGRYVVGYKQNDTYLDFIVYDISKGNIINITSNVPIPRHDADFDFPRKLRILDIAGWMADDSAIIVYDNYDIWQIDPLGKKAPIRLTDGRNKKLQFRFVDNYRSIEKTISGNEVLLLKAFNSQTKQSGFYRLKMGSFLKPELLYMGDYFFNFLRNDKGDLLKAKNENTYLLIRESSLESPNIVSTTNFRTFNSITKVFPEKAINWLTADLINFKNQNGDKIQAILYKPEDFDSRKRYPVIINYYDKKSDELNKFRNPVVDNGGEIDIPWFVSHGYLVVLTDIHYEIGKTGKSVKDCVEGVAIHLSRFPYVDKKRIGIQGHSFGGWETNYLATNSHLFAAAVASSGPSDLVSFYGSIWFAGTSQQEYLEKRRLRIAATPWDRPDLYVINSPVFYVGNVTTPILLVANRKDFSCRFEQGLEFFTALRRAGKRTWMLEYDNGGHGVIGKDYKDYVIRMSQFFDHYLKDSAAPRWMLYGIPAKDKGIDDGFKLVREKDSKTGKWITPGPGLLIEEEQKKADALQKRKRIAITIE